MKQCIRYCIIVLLAALLHNGAVEAADFLCIPASVKTEHCILTQAPTTQQAIRNFYNYLSSTTSCLEHVDITQVPGNKSILLRTDIIRLQQSLRAQDCDHLSYLYYSYVPDPHYYVFGLRKIIV